MKLDVDFDGKRKIPVGDGGRVRFRSGILQWSLEGRFR
jgi:hypothetical protein